MGKNAKNLNQPLLMELLLKIQKSTRLYGVYIVFYELHSSSRVFRVLVVPRFLPDICTVISDKTLTLHFPSATGLSCSKNACLYTNND